MSFSSFNKKQEVRLFENCLSGIFHCLDINDEKLSSSDEEDLRVEQLLLKDKWRAIFDQFDPEGFGEIPWSEFLVVINQEEFRDQVPPEKIDSLHDLAYKYKQNI